MATHIIGYARGVRHASITTMLTLWTLIVPAAALAAPPDWPTLLSSDAVSSYIDGPVIVVEAGTVHPSRAPAAEALRAALTTAAPDRLVMSGDAIGDVAGLSDDAIAAKAKHLPVNVVVTVRVFGYGGAASAVFAVLRKDGTRDGFSVAREQPLLSRSAPSAPQEAAPPVGALPDSTGAPRAETPLGGLPPVEEAIREYRRNAIHVQEFMSVGVQTGRVYGQWGVPYKGYGDNRVELDPPEFFSHVGRSDLEESYGARKTSKTVLFTVGGLTTLTGLILVFFPDTTKVCYRPDDCYDEADYGGPTAITAFSLLGVGTVVMMAPLFYRTSPVDEKEVRQLSRDYNAALRRKLGLPEDYDGEGPVPERPSSPPPPKVVFGAAPMDGGLFATGTVTF